jgi:hypothetical protein
MNVDGAGNSGERRHPKSLVGSPMIIMWPRSTAQQSDTGGHRRNRGRERQLESQTLLAAKPAPQELV